MKTDIPDYPVFTPLDYSLKEEIYYSIKTIEPLVSELSLGGLYGYKKNMDIKLTRIFDNICLLYKVKEDSCFLSPLGSKKILQTIAVCLKHLKESYGKGSIYCIDKKYLDELIKNGYKPAPDRDNFDYVYRVEDMANLQGQKYQSKRNLVNGFFKNISYDYIKLTSEVVGECKSFQESWCNIKKCKQDMNLIAENFAVSELLDNFKEINLFGGIIRINGKIEAFTIAEQLNADTAVIHIEKANSNIRGLYQAINSIFCKEELLGRFEFVNREQDMGNAGLRKAKLSYHPAFMIEKYYIKI